TWYRDLLLEQDRNAPVDAEQAGTVLANALRPRAAELFRSDQAASALLKRVALLREHLPQHPWPKFDEDELADVLAERCAGKRSVEEVLRGALVEALRGRLMYPLDRILEEQAPETIEVPSGSHIKLDYSGDVPVLAVRLQELFGWT